MEKRSFIKLFLLLQAVFFAVAAEELPLVLVAEVDNTLYPLSVTSKDFTPDAQYLGWDRTGSAPIQFIKQEDNSLLSTNAYKNGYLTFEHNILQLKEKEKTAFEISDDYLVLKDDLDFCLTGNYFDYLSRPKRVKTNCPQAKIYLLPFDKVRGIVKKPRNGKLVEEDTALQEFTEFSLILFANVENKWRPIREKIEKDNLGVIYLNYENSLKYPVNFEAKNQEFVNFHKNRVMYPCLEGTMLSLQADCQKKVTFDEELIVEQKMFVCEGLEGFLLTESVHSSCKLVEARLFEHSESPDDKLFDFVSPVPEAPKVSDISRVFAVKNDNDYTYTLIYPRFLSTDTQILDYKKDVDSKNIIFGGKDNEIDSNNPLEFEYAHEVALVKDNENPRRVQFDSLFMTVGAKPATRLRLTEEWQVDKKFFTCHLSHGSDSDENSIPNLMLQDSKGACLETKVYLLPYNRQTRQVEDYQGNLVHTVDDIPKYKKEAAKAKSKEASSEQESGVHAKETNKDEDTSSATKQFEALNPGKDTIGTNSLDVGSTSVRTGVGSTTGTEQEHGIQDENLGVSHGPVDGSTEESNVVSEEEQNSEENITEINAEQNKIKQKNNTENRAVIENPTEIKNPAEIENLTKIENPVQIDNHLVHAQTKSTSKIKENLEAGGGAVNQVSDPKVWRNDTGIPNPRIEVSGTQIENSGIEVKTLESKTKGTEKNLGSLESNTEKTEKEKTEKKLSTSDLNTKDSTSESATSVSKINGTDKNDAEKKVGTSDSNTNVSEPKVEKSEKKVGTSESNSNSYALKSKKEKSGSKLEFFKSKKVSSKDLEVSPVSASKPKNMDKSKISVPGSSKAQAITEDTKNCTTNCNECQSCSKTTVWKTYTNYTTYVAQPTTVTITVCEEVCVPSTMTVAAPTTLTVTGKCIVPETTTVEHTAKEHPEVKGGLSRGGNPEEQKHKVNDSTRQKEVKGEAHGQKEVKEQLHDQKESFGQKEGSKPSQPKASEFKTDKAKGIDKSGKTENARTFQKTGTDFIPKPTIAPVVNAASKNVFDACIAVGLAALLV